METPAPKSERLLSLDALRGFDLFWIVGGHGILVALFKLTEWGWLGAIDAQLKHFPLETLTVPKLHSLRLGRYSEK